MLHRHKPLLLQHVTWCSIFSTAQLILTRLRASIGVTRSYLSFRSYALLTYKVQFVLFHMWQSRVEIEHYSVAYFDRIAAFEVL